MKFTLNVTIYLAITYTVFAQEINLNHAYQLLGSDKDSTYAIVTYLLTQDLSLKDQYQAYYLKGYIEQKRGQNQEALWSYLESLRLLDLSNFSDDSNKATMFNQIGKIYKQYAHYELAIEYYRMSLKVSPEEYKKSIYYNIANALNKLGKGVEAIDSYQEALKYAEGDVNQEAKINSMIGVTNYTYGNFRAAENYLYRVVNQLGKIDTAHIGRAYHRLGANYLLKGDTSKAISSYQTALTYKKGGIDNFNTLLDLAEIYLSKENFNEVVRLCNQAEQFKAVFSNEPTTSRIFQFRADAYYGLGKIDHYKREVDKCLAFNQRLNKQIEEAVIEGKRDIITEVTRRHEEAVINQAQQRRYLWLGVALVIFILLTLVLAYQEYKKQKIKQRIATEIKNLQQQYTHRI